MLIFDRLLLGGVKFVLRRVSDAVETELNDETMLRGRLLEAVEKLERGDISEDEYVETEALVLDRLRVIREEREGTSGGAAIEFKAGGGATVEAEATFVEVPRPETPAPETKKKARRKKR
jgi:hypothetical protein